MGNIQSTALQHPTRLPLFLTFLGRDIRGEWIGPRNLQPCQESLFIHSIQVAQLAAVAIWGTWGSLLTLRCKVFMPSSSLVCLEPSSISQLRACTSVPEQMGFQDVLWSVQPGLRWRTFLKCPSTMIRCRVDLNHLDIPLKFWLCSFASTCLNYIHQPHKLIRYFVARFLPRPWLN